MPFFFSRPRSKRKLSEDKKTKKFYNTRKTNYSSSSERTYSINMTSRVTIWETQFECGHLSHTCVGKYPDPNLRNSNRDKSSTRPPVFLEHRCSDCIERMRGARIKSVAHACAEKKRQDEETWSRCAHARACKAEYAQERSTKKGDKGAERQIKRESP